MTGAADTTLIDGQPAAWLPVADRAVQYGDGLFETISCREGRARWLALHLQRLRSGCERLRLPFTEYVRLAAEVESLAQGQSQCIVKVIVSRGVAVRRGYRPAGTERPTRIVSRHEWPADDGDPLRVGLSAVPLGTNPRLAGLKHLNRLEQVVAQIERPTDLDEVLMLSSAGVVISGSMSNVFFADDRGLFTPDLASCGVEGVMRRVVLESLGGSRTCAALPVSIRPVQPRELDTVREVFLTNVRWGVRTVGQLMGRTLPSDDYAQQVRRWVDEAGA
jgi:4-amino-4-deoxychorismate lyase